MSIETLKALDIVVVVFVEDNGDDLITTHLYNNKYTLEEIQEILECDYLNPTILNVSR